MSEAGKRISNGAMAGLAFSLVVLVGVVCSELHTAPGRETLLHRKLLTTTRVLEAGDAPGDSLAAVQRMAPYTGDELPADLSNIIRHSLVTSRVGAGELLTWKHFAGGLHSTPGRSVSERASVASTVTTVAEILAIVGSDLREGDEIEIMGHMKSAQMPDAGPGMAMSLVRRAGVQRFLSGEQACAGGAEGARCRRVLVRVDPADRRVLLFVEQTAGWQLHLLKRTGGE